MTVPTRTQSNAVSMARPISSATTLSRIQSSSARSVQRSTGATGTTRVCPGWCGAMVRNATISSSRHTKRPGRSPRMMRVNSVGSGVSSVMVES